MQNLRTVTKMGYEQDTVTTFDRRNGEKVRWGKSSLTKGEFPELVDIKVTNYCPHECVFCYQSSTPQGQHGDIGYLEEVLKSLALIGTFEVALGGGEPALHPNFIDILKLADGFGLVPNYTTYGVYSNRTDWDSIARLVGGIGVSVHGLTQVNKVKAVEKELRPYASVYERLPTVTSQHVFGTLGHSATKDLIKESKNILLLGYKTVGFGNRMQPFKFTDQQVADLLESVNPNQKLSVDTAFIDNYSHVLKELRVPKILWASPEGKFSCYIDAVEESIAPSSYCSKENYSSLMLPKPENIMKEFLKY